MEISGLFEGWIVDGDIWFEKVRLICNRIQDSVRL